MILPQLARERVADFYPLGELDVNLRALPATICPNSPARQGTAAAASKPFAFDRLVTRPADCPALGNLRPAFLTMPCHDALANNPVRSGYQGQKQRKQEVRRLVVADGEHTRPRVWFATPRREHWGKTFNAGARRSYARRVCSPSATTKTPNFCIPYCYLGLDTRTRNGIISQAQSWPRHCEKCGAGDCRGLDSLPVVLRAGQTRKGF